MNLFKTENHKLIGSWHLEKYEIRNQQKQPVLLWGKSASGLLIYLDNGYMSVQVSNNDRPVFANDDLRAGSTEEIFQAFTGYTAYFGKYKYQEKNNRVFHYVEQSAFPNWNGVTHTRFVSLNDAKLTLRTPPILINGESCEMQMFWQRIE